MVLSGHCGCVSSCSFTEDGEQITIGFGDAESFFVLDSLFVSVGYDCNVNVWCNLSHRLRNTYKVKMSTRATVTSCFLHN